jgi:predicted nuclease of predicted toxin-antitoxin system
MPKRRLPALRLLIDACLTPAVIPHLAGTVGSKVDAVHTDRILGPATSDERVLDWAMHEGRVVITANSADFLTLVHNRPGHCGLGLIDDQNTRVRQIEAIERLVCAIILHVEDGGSVPGHVFVLRRAARLSVRRIPS